MTCKEPGKFLPTFLRRPKLLPFLKQRGCNSELRFQFSVLTTFSEGQKAHIQHFGRSIARAPCYRQTQMHRLRNHTHRSELRFQFPSRAFYPTSLGLSTVARLSGVQRELTKRFLFCAGRLQSRRSTDSGRFRYLNSLICTCGLALSIYCSSELAWDPIPLPVEQSAEAQQKKSKFSFEHCWGRAQPPSHKSKWYWG